MCDFIRLSKNFYSALFCGSVVLALAGCGTQEPPRSVQPPVGGLTATLEDTVRDLPGDRIAWATYWTLCWSPYPGARAYQIQTVTGEGASAKLRQQRDTCLRIEAAKGENARTDGLVNRDLLLQLQTGQLAYKVRAVLDDTTVSEWSASAAVGQTAP